jgi:hypothetical protein
MSDPWKEEFTSADGVYRSAFPAYRVFIFGNEVTQDVMDVRITHSGGSLERMPGSCAFTLVNPYDKYIITRDDMKVIGSSRASFKGQYDSSYSVPLYSDADIEQMGIYISGEASSDAAQEEAPSAASVTSELEEKGALGLEWSSSYVPMDVKLKVLSKKMTWSQDATEVKDSEVIHYKKEVLFDYPVQEGDCIFHPNDPVRVAFRDPYDPRVWYWMFTGFMDSFTENKGTNKESTVLITCTDITKIARHAIVNVDTGILDVNVTEKLKTIANTSSTGLNLYQEYFAGMTVFEVLEVLFFGSDSLLGFVKQSKMDQIAQMSNDDIMNYISTQMVSSLTYKNAITEWTNGLGSSTIGSDQGDVVSWKSDRNFLVEFMVNREVEIVKGTLTQGRDLGAIASPRGVRFKRNNGSVGVTAYYIGESMEGAPEIGTKLTDLKQWNDLISHRITPKDLYTMHKDESPTSYSENMKDIISIIGENIESYPVGGGRVYFLTQAQLAKGLGTNVIDKSLSTNSIVARAVYLDRLTLLYELAACTDFYRFYATPKGDLVFELAFYDYDPDQFGPSTDASGKYDPADSIYKYQEDFDTIYTGKYSDTDVQTLTNMQMGFQEMITGFQGLDFSQIPKVNYVKEQTIEPYEQISFSNTATDDGIFTLYVSVKKAIAGLSGTVGNESIRPNYATARGLVPTLGARVKTTDPWGFIDTDEGSEIFANLMLRRQNAEMRNLSIGTTPKFGLMVNRPVYWKYRNYFATVVSLVHSIVWNSNCDTTININSVRGWGGKTDNKGNYVHEYFGGDYAFNPASFVKQAIFRGSDKGQM